MSIMRGSLEQRLIEARRALVEYSKDCESSLTLVSTFEDHMIVLKDSGERLKLDYRDGRVISTVEIPEENVQSLRHFSLINIISEEIHRIKEELKEINASTLGIELEDSQYQTENIEKILNRLELLEVTAKEKRFDRFDKSFFKKVLNFIDDLSVYLKRLLKESKQTPISFALVEDIAVIVGKVVTSLEEGQG